MKTILLFQCAASEKGRLADFLAAEGFSVMEGQGGIEPAIHLSDVVVLDVTKDPFARLRLFQRIRDERDDIPIVVLADAETRADRLLGFRLGYDDYVKKPIRSEALKLRLQMALRRSARQGDRVRVLRWRGLIVDFDCCEARIEGERVHLTKKEFKLLRALCERNGKVVSRCELLARVWGSASRNARVVDTHIAQLRAKLEDDSSGLTMIQTIHGIGYRIRVLSGALRQTS